MTARKEWEKRWRAVRAARRQGRPVDGRWYLANGYTVTIKAGEGVKQTRFGFRTYQQPRFVTAYAIASDPTPRPPRLPDGMGGKPLKRERWRAGVLFRGGSLWLGIHWSPYNKRACINLFPCVTVWVTKPGGNPP